MTATSSHDLTHLLVAWSDGDQTALDKLVPLVYDELRRLARRYMIGWEFYRRTCVRDCGRNDGSNQN